MRQRTQVVYTKELHERQTFMEDLKAYRKRMRKKYLKTVRKLVGPRWYQALSVPQRKALDNLKSAVYQDLLSGLPTNTSVIIDALGIYPPPHCDELMICNLAGKDDPMRMLAELFFIQYGHSIEGKRDRYPLNARLILSGIFYLGLKNLIELLRETFKPDRDVPGTPPEPRPRRTPASSPYLQKTIIPYWSPAEPKNFKPPPLPNLDKLNENYVGQEEIRVQKKIPPPPPPPPPKRLSKSLCDQLANIIRIEPESQVTALALKSTITSRKRRASNSTIEVKKKTYGICVTGPKKQSSRRRIKPPSTGRNNMQYMIQGVFYIGTRKVFVLGSVSITPDEGELIHGGFASCEQGYVNVHCGFRAHSAPPPPDPCNCLQAWEQQVFEYVKNNKCRCGHHYDYANEGPFPPDMLPYFEKPVAGAPYQFNYATIFTIDEKQLLVKKEMNKVWETDSVIGYKKDVVVKKKDKRKEKEEKKDERKEEIIDEKNDVKTEDNKDEKKEVKKDEKQEEKSSKTCLGPNPKPEDYLRCALRSMRGVNLAARLPDVHLTAELLQWMRRRIHGPYSAAEREVYIQHSKTLQAILDSHAVEQHRRLVSNREIEYKGNTNWSRKPYLRDRFTKDAEHFKRQLFRFTANMNNLLWRIMFHAEFPDKKFREIFFSYMGARAEDLQLIRPYNSTEANERRLLMANRRYVCLPAGTEPRT